MTDNIIQLNEEIIKTELKDFVRSSLEETLNTLFDKEADELRGAKLYMIMKHLDQMQSAEEVAYIAR